MIPFLFDLSLIYFSYLGCVRLTLFRNKNNRNKPEQPFDWDAIPIPEYMECIPNILLQRAEYLE